MSEVLLQKLTLYNFKNYSELSLNIENRATCFVGKNGAGKTNLLDAIHYLCTCKSYFNAVDSQCIRFDTDQFALTGDFIRMGQPEHIVCSVRRNQRKIVKRNFKEYDRLSEHIGLLPCVMITPYDIELIWEGSEVRRKFLDSTLAHLSRTYLDDLIAYNHALLQRNAVLKTYSGNAHFPEEFLEIWDMQLIERAGAIHEARSSFLVNFRSVFQRVYSEIASNTEEVSLQYDSELNESTMEKLLHANRKRDRMLERTSTGIHRDDIDFLIGGHPLKKFASQGQQKSFLFALKFAQYLFIREAIGASPILLLDDFFDKIDDQRVSNIIRWLSRNEVGQMFITDTHAERAPRLLQEAGITVGTMKAENGSLLTL